MFLNFLAHRWGGDSGAESARADGRARSIEGWCARARGVRLIVVDGCAGRGRVGGGRDVAGPRTVLCRGGRGVMMLIDPRVKEC